MYRGRGMYFLYGESVLLVYVDYHILAGPSRKETIMSSWVWKSKVKMMVDYIYHSCS
jgi:hypothetical protein